MHSQVCRWCSLISSLLKGYFQRCCLPILERNCRECMQPGVTKALDMLACVFIVGLYRWWIKYSVRFLLLLLLIRLETPWNISYIWEGLPEEFCLLAGSRLSVLSSAQQKGLPMYSVRHNPHVLKSLHSMAAFVLAILSGSGWNRCFLSVIHGGRCKRQLIRGPFMEVCSRCTLSLYKADLDSFYWGLGDSIARQEQWFNWPWHSWLNVGNKPTMHNGLQRLL